MTFKSLILATLVSVSCAAFGQTIVPYKSGPAAMTDLIGG